MRIHRIAWVFLVVCVFLVAADAHAEADPGSLAVEVAEEVTLRAEDRQKSLPCKVYVPSSGGPYPVIVFSHGFGGNKDAFASAGRHWASHGYVVIHPTHADGLAQRAGGREAGDDEKPMQLRSGGLLKGLNDPGRIADRVADIVLVMDSLEKLPKEVPALMGRIDKERIGVGGHSFGAYTAMLIGGVTVDLGGEKARSFRDARVRCILPISGQGTGQQGLTDQSWAGLRLPMMTITGTRDRGVGGQAVEWKKEPYQFSPPGDKYLVVIEGANHFSFGGGLGRRSSGVTDLVNLYSTCFWDAYLKDSGAAKEFLHSERPARDSGGALTYEKK